MGGRATLPFDQMRVSEAITIKIGCVGAIACVLTKTENIRVGKEGAGLIFSSMDKQLHMQSKKRN